MGGGKGDKAQKKVVAASVAAATATTATLHPKTADKAAKGSKTPSPPATASAIATTPPAPNPTSPLAALVMGLLALVAAHKATATKGMALALLTALEALAQRFERLLSDGSEPGPQARVVPIAHVDGPVIGLSFRRFGSLGSILLPEGHDSGLIRLHNDIETVLDHHGNEGTGASEALVVALWGALGLVRQHLQSPKSALLADCNDLNEVHLCLVDPAKPAPIALSPVHLELIKNVQNALEHLIEAREELGNLRDELEDLDRDLAKIDPNARRVDHTLVGAGYARRLARAVSNCLGVTSHSLKDAARVLHGSDTDDASPQAVALLASLDAFHTEQGWRTYALEMAQGSFARAS